MWCPLKLTGLTLMVVVSEKHVCNATECIITVRGHFRVNHKVVDFGTNRKRVFNFLLVVICNLCRILHRYGDTET